MENIFFINAVFIIGLHSITRDGMIFGFVENLFSTKRNNYNDGGNIIKIEWIPKRLYSLFKPITECVTCMASVWGFAGFLFTGLEWQWLPAWCICLAGFNNLVTSLCWRE